MRTVLTLTLLLFTMPALAGPKGETGDNKVLSPYFFVEGTNPGSESFPLKSTQVTANIIGVIADVTVTPVYENHGHVPIHAKYVFPGSTGAAVHGMRIRVRDKVVVARTAVTLRMSFALGGSQPTPTCLVIMDVSATGVTSTSLSSSYNGSDSCEPAVALGSITMTRQ